MIGKTIFSILCFFGAVLLTACDEKNTDQANTPGNQALLTIGTSADMPPFEFYKSGDGETIISGFDVELAHQVAKEMGVSVKIKDMDFSTLIPALQAGRVDLVMASMSPSPERQKNIDFSKTYLQLPLGIITKTGHKVSSFKDFKGKKIGVQLGSVHEKTLQDHARKDPSLQVVSLNKLGELVQELLVGRIDGVLMEITSAHEFVQPNKALAMNVISDQQVDFAIAFAKGSPWIEKVNLALSKLEKAGEIETLKKKWFKLS